MEGDYFRYLSEFELDDAQKQDYIASAEKSYKKALDKSQKHLKATNQLRLGVALNFSVF